MRVAGPLPEEQREGALATNASKVRAGSWIGTRSPPRGAGGTASGGPAPTKEIHAELQKGVLVLLFRGSSCSVHKRQAKAEDNLQARPGHARLGPRQKTSCRLAQTRTNPERERERERKKKKKKARAPGSGESGAGPISHAVLGVAVSWCMTRQCAETVFAGGVGGRREGGGGGGGGGGAAGVQLARGWLVGLLLRPRWQQWGPEKQTDCKCKDAVGGAHKGVGGEGKAS
ncbi:unnamed protein product [Prorocentrum cordatum]|uniref:Uncharacterized protein n=1 Tax=Prorocentrum cordatum TaxID=2364126 RepID=A0ABN9UBB4_9DINO|nr:unnamed protein product [Polarella glacialis]